MMRLVMVGCGIVWGSVAYAQSPVSVYPTARTQPPPTQPMPPPAPPMSSVNQPLPQVVASGVPVIGCTTGCTSYAACPRHRRASRPCLQRVWDWLTYQPCPRVLPILTPTPYQAPLRAYFPCTPDHGRAAAPGCGTSCRPNLLPRLHGAPAACASCPAPRVPLVSRLMRFLDPRPHPYKSGTWSGNCGANGDCPCPPAGAYRYAAPCVVPPPSSPYQQQGAVQMVPAQPAANRPFTTP